MPLRSFTQAEIEFTERKRFELPLLVLAWLSVAGFSLAEGSVFYVFAATLAVGVNLWASWRTQEVYLARKFVNIGVLLATGITLLEIFLAEEVVLVSLSHYVILIQLCKLFERKKNRDYVQILVLSLLLMLSASLLSMSPWFTIVLVAHLALACHTTMVFTLKRGLDKVAAARLASESGPMDPERAAWNVIRAWPKQAIRRRLGHVMIAILVTGVVVFLVTPRAGGYRRSRLFGRRKDAITGFTDSVTLGDVSEIYLSDRTALRVRLRDAKNRPYKPPGALYLRGKTFHRYADSCWWRTGRTEGAVRFSSEFPSDLPLSPGGELIVAEVSLSPALNQAVFTLHPVLWVAGERSYYVSERQYPAMMRLFPETALLTVPGAGHWVHSEQPAATIEGLRNFLLAEGLLGGPTP